MENSNDLPIDVETLGGEETGNITAISILSDGDTILTGSEDGAVRAWSYSKKKLVKELDDAHADIVTGIAISKDESVFITCSGDKSFKIWSVVKLKLVETYKDIHEDTITGIAITADNGMIITSGIDEKLELWELVYKDRHTYKSPAGAKYTAMAFAPESKLIATGSRDNKLRLWSVRELYLIKSFDNVQDFWITGIQFINNETEIVTTGGDNTINIFNVKSLSLTKSITIEADMVTNVTYSEQYNMFALASSNLIKIWSTKDWSCIKTFNTKQDGFVTLGIINQNTLAVGGNGSLQIWDFEKDCCKINFRQIHKNEITGLAITGDKKNVISTSLDGSVRIWDLAMKQLYYEATSAHGGGPVKSLALAHHSKFFVTGGQADMTIKIWNLEGKCQHTFEEAHDDVVSCLFVQQDNAHVISGGGDEHIKVWALATRKLDYSIKCAHQYNVNAVEVTPDEKFIVSTGGDQVIKIWRIKDKSLFFQFESAHNFAWINSIKLFGDDEIFCVSAADEGTMKLWNITKKVFVHSIHDAHVGDVTTIALTKDQRLVSGSSDKSVKMWSLKDYKMENKLNMVHSSKVSALSVSKDGEIIISGSSNGSMKIIKFK